jgi:hypothetical protein
LPYSLHKKDLVLFGSPENFLDLPCTMVDVCPHLRQIGRPRRHDGFMIEGKHNLETCSNKSKLRQMPLLLHRISNRHDSIYSNTKWLDLGEGWTLLDSKWRSHLPDAYTNNQAFAAKYIHQKRLNGRGRVNLDLGLFRVQLRKRRLSGSTPT